MSKMTHTRKAKALAATCAYLLITALSATAFYFLRQTATDGSRLKYAYTVFGPALSLFTHMSYFLFAAQSLLLVPWLVLAVVWPTSIRACAIAFGLVWLGIGWYMHDLF